MLCIFEENVGGNQRKKFSILFWGNWGMPRTLKDNKDIKQCQGHVGEYLTTLGKRQRCRVTLRKHHRTQDLVFQSTRKCRKNDKDVKQHSGNTERHQATLGKHWGTPSGVKKMPREHQKKGFFFVSFLRQQGTSRGHQMTTIVPNKM